MTNKHDERVEKIVEEFNQFIVTWCSGDWRHLLDTDDNDGERFRKKLTTLTKEVREQTLAEVREFVDTRMGGDISATAQFPDSPEHKYAYDYLVQNRRELIELLDTLENKK